MQYGHVGLCGYNTVSLLMLLAFTARYTPECSGEWVGIIFVGRWAIIK